MKYKNARCLQCGSEMKQAGSVKRTLAGLSGVVIRGLPAFRCPECGETEVVIPQIQELHTLLAGKIIRKSRPLTGEEIRFLRKCLGWSGVDFAKHAGVAPETVSRWENGRGNISGLADRFMRLAIAKFEPIANYKVEDLDNISVAAPKPMKLVARKIGRAWAVATS